jgi:hypothetical protein
LLILRNPALINFFDLCAISLPLPRAGRLPAGLSSSRATATIVGCSGWQPQWNDYLRRETAVSTEAAAF